MKVKEALLQFDVFLNKKGLSFEAVVIGAAALVVMDIISRETIDVDCLEPEIPEEILKAAAEFRNIHPEHKLPEKWINNGPHSLLRDLSKDWRTRIRIIFKGKALVLSTLGRADLLKTKLFAYCDRDDDLMDCLAMKPTSAELDRCYEWVAARDGNPMWPEHVRKYFDLLKKRLGHDAG